MGYYTQYHLTEEKNPTDTDALEIYLNVNDLNWLVNERDNEPTKWYDHDEDMKKLSKAFPKTVFKLHGNGEEQGDVWDKYYQNGKLLGRYEEVRTMLKPDLSKF